MWYTKFCDPCLVNGIEHQVHLMDDANIIPLMNDNANHWWNKWKRIFPSHVQYLLEQGHDYALQGISHTSCYKTLDVRRRYCEQLDAHGWSVIKRAFDSC